MNKNDDRVRACIYRLYDFRKKIPANLNCKKVKGVWDLDISQEKIPELIETKQDVLKQKTGVVEKNLNWLVCKPFVKFVGVSGSIGSDFVKKSDDIDLFIVVKNDTAWIYRLYLYFMNIFKKQLRSKEKNSKKEVKDKLCINLITEERYLLFENDIFNFNELLYLKPIYNKRFLKVIYISNLWMQDEYLVSDDFLGKNTVQVKDLKNLGKRNWLLIPINIFSFLGELSFMILMKHQPDYKRLWEGLIKGRIEFFPKGFKEDKMGD